MALLDEVATKLASLGVGTVGTTLFKGMMPETPDVCAAVFEYGGMAPEYAFGTEGISREMPSIQVVCRGIADDYAGPRAKIDLAYQGLAKVECESLTSTGSTGFYHWIHPNQAPFVRDRDANGRVYFVVNFSIDKELSA